MLCGSYLFGGVRKHAAEALDFGASAHSARWLQ
jgi:hypothetical protein